MKSILLIAALAIAQSAFAGSISGAGNGFPTAKQPPGNYSYTCHLEITQTFGNGVSGDPGSCYVTYTSDLKLKNEPESVTGELVGAKLKDLKFVLASEDGSCDPTLKINWDNTFLALFAFKNLAPGRNENQYINQLTLKIEPMGNGLTGASSESVDRFSEGGVEGTTEYSSDNVILTLSATCDLDNLGKRKK
jgi:hypothetical protein